jgi:hypothetical protein
MHVFVTLRELGASLSVSPSISPDHQPRTLLMAANTSLGDWSTVKDAVKSCFGMIRFCSFILIRELYRRALGHQRNGNTPSEYDLCVTAKHRHDLTSDGALARHQPDKYGWNLDLDLL